MLAPLPNHLFTLAVTSGIQIFANIHDLPSASDVANTPEKYNKLKREVQMQGGARLLDHRPHQEHGPPLDILCETFAQFSLDVRNCIPSLEASRLVGKLVDLVSKVGGVAHLACGKFDGPRLNGEKHAWG